MQGRNKLLSVAVGLAFAGAALATDYNWAGHGTGDDWDVNGNWTYPCCDTPAWPHGTDDNASAQAGTGAWAMNLITVSIGEMLVRGDVDFADAETDPTLTVSKFTIDPSVEGGIVLTMTDATITKP